jgi:CheY-like chemotaxis protein
MLGQLGYLVLSGGSPPEALHLAESHPGRIDLILADLVLPRMNGRDLAHALGTLHPEARRLFMSGYAPDPTARDEGAPFLQKPFSLRELELKVREALTA